MKGLKMKLLSRPEELVLLSVWRLNDDAYCVPIREILIDTTKKDWSFGAVYDPLDRLEKRGYLSSHLSDPVNARGGRSKRIYTLTKDGMKALIEIKEVNDTMWEGITRVAIENKL